MKLFRNREAAGKQLGAALRELDPSNPLLIALPRGGIPIAEEIHKETSYPWDIWTVQKLSVPENPEFALGALAEDSEPFWNEKALREHHIDREDVDLWEARSMAHHSRQAFRGSRPLPDVQDRLVVVVDDGLATGISARAVARALREHGAREIWGLFPVGNAGADLGDDFDQTVCLYKPKEFHYVSQFYEEFPVVGNEEIVHDIEIR